MGRFRHTVTLVCFISFSIVASLAALRTIRAGLPETPATTGAGVLVAHLSDVDMEGYDRTTKRHEAHRVMRQLRDEVDWQADVAALSPAQQKQFLDNLAVLAQEIVEQKMDAYFSIPERDQRRYLNRQIEEVMRWAMLLDRATKKSGESGIRMTAMFTLMTRLNKWYSEADPEQRRKLQVFQKAFQEQLTERMKRGMQPGG